MINTFVSAIHTKNKLRVAFHSKSDKNILVRTCAPMDYGPSRHAHDKSDRLHMWDYDSDAQRHTLSLLPDQIVSIEVLHQQFDPKDFVTWDTAVSTWFISRDWGKFS